MNVRHSGCRHKAGMTVEGDRDSLTATPVQMRLHRTTGEGFQRCSWCASLLAAASVAVSLDVALSSDIVPLSGTAAAAAFSVGVGVGLGTVATTLPTAVVVIESAEFCPTAAGLPPHPASMVRITPTNSTRFMPISLIAEIVTRSARAVKAGRVWRAALN
jgi:hypothetical protein